MKSWWQRERISAPILVAIGALIVAMIIGGWGFYVHSDEMQFNLFAELAGVLFEVAVVVLVIDWLVQRRERRRWRHACPMISDRFATAFTDAMRLLYVAGTQGVGYSDDLDRYPAFHKRFARSLDHLQSTVEGFALALESSAHYALRDLEVKMRWLHDRLEEPKRNLDHEFQVSLETAEEFERFCMETWGSDFRNLKASIVAVIERAAPEVTDSSASIDRGAALILRYQLQNVILQASFGDSRPLSVLLDYSQKASVHYFILDRLLLPRHVIRLPR